MKATHDLDIKRLQGVASGLNEEHASMDAVVNNVHAVDLVLGIQVGIESLLNVVDNGAPRLIVVDEVAEAGSVDHSKAQTNTGLLDIGADGLDSDSLGNDVEARPLALLGRVERGVEEGVDQCRLAQTRFTNDHDVEVESLANTLAVPLVGQVGETNIASQLPADNVVVLGRSGSRRRRESGRVRDRNTLDGLHEVAVLSGRRRSHGGRGVGGGS